MLYNLSAITQETFSLVIEYIFYGGIFVIGLVILICMRRRSRRPVPRLAVDRTEEADKKMESILTAVGKRGSEYTFPARLLQIGSDVGDLVLLADRELTENRNIAFEDILAAYQAAADRLAAVNAWDAEAAPEGLQAVKAELEKALGILKKLTKEGKKQPA